MVSLTPSCVLFKVVDQLDRKSVFLAELGCRPVHHVSIRVLHSVQVLLPVLTHYRINFHLELHPWYLLINVSWLMLLLFLSFLSFFSFLGRLVFIFITFLLQSLLLFALLLRLRLVWFNVIWYIFQFRLFDGVFTSIILFRMFKLSQRKSLPYIFFFLNPKSF